MKQLLKTLYFIILVTQICFSQWYQQTSGTTATLCSIHFVDANNGWAVGGNCFDGCDTSLILHTTNAGLLWTRQESGTVIPLKAIYFIDSVKGWAVGGYWVDSLMTNVGIILHTSNGGIHWETQWQGGNLFIPRSVFFIDSLTGWAAGDSWPSDWHSKSSIWSTLDGGETWQNQYEGDLDTYMASVFFNNSLIGWAVGSTNNSSVNPPMLHTTDGGVHWIRLEEGLTPLWEAISVQFTDANNGWIVGRECYLTTDGGMSWANHSPPIGRVQHHYSAFLVDTSCGYIIGNNWDIHGVGKGHIARTTNSGTEWSVQYFAQDTAFFGCYFIDSNTGWVVGNKGLILHTTNGGVTFVEEETIDKVPTEFMLEQNYPNPFNSSCTIKYSLPKSKQVSLKIFNVLGSELETLIDEEKSAGTYELNWNAANLPSGVYFYQLRAGSFVETKKMLLLK